MASVIDHALEEFAAEVGPVGPIAIQGGKTRWDANGVPTPEARVLSAPTGIVTYKPEEMIVTARAGTTVEDLHTHSFMSVSKMSKFSTKKIAEYFFIGA